MATLHRLLMLLLALSSAHAQQGWFELASGVDDDLFAVDFIDNDTGYVVGGNGLILKTSNGGLNWRKLYIEGNQDASFWDVKFKDHMWGIAVGFLSKESGADSSYQCITTDGGNTWKCQTGQRGIILMDISIPDDTSVFVFGQRAETTSLLTSNDCGRTWTSRNLGTTTEPSDPWGFVRGGDFASRKQGMMVTTSQSFSALWTTTDAGNTWKRLDLGIEIEGFHTIRHISGRTWIIGAEQATILSSDDGSKWAIVNGHRNGGTASRPAFRLDFANESTGYSAPGTDRGYIQKSTDGGATWISQLYIDIGDGLYDISAPSGNVAYAVGQSGRIIKTTDGGGPALGIDDNGTDPAGMTIHPNPARDALTVRIDPEARPLTISMFDMLGRMVLNRPIDAGRRDFRIDLSELGAGAYILQAGDERRIIVVTGQ